MEEFILKNYMPICIVVLVLVTALCAYVGYRRAWEVDQDNIVIRRAVNNRTKEHFNPGSVVAVVIIILVWVLVAVVFKDKF